MINKKHLKRSNANKDILSILAGKFQAMKETFQEENAILADQINLVEQALAERRVLIDRLLGNHSDPDDFPHRAEFPIETEEDLARINDAINDTNRSAYIKTMAIVVQPKGIYTNLRKILSDRIAVNFNVDGVLGKKSLKDYSNFYEALLKSIPVTNLSGPAQTQLRDALQLQKRRHFKLMYDERKKKNESNHEESIDDGSNSNMELMFSVRMTE